MGGLGNQLFQLAAGLSLSNKSNRSLVIDESFGNFRKNDFGHADIHGYGFNHHYSFYNKTKQSNFFSRTIGLLVRLSLDTSQNRLHRIAKNSLIYFQSLLLSKQFDNKVKIWSANNLGYEEIFLENNSQYLLGYFQTHKFASRAPVKAILKKLSSSDPTVSLHKKICLREKPLIVHVRLGDYSEELNFGLLSKEYYYSAITLMISKFNFENIHVYSDEIEKARSFIPKKYYKFCKWMDNYNEPAVVTLEKMRCGYGYIVGNSSFSWWAAFLSHTDNPPTIAPQPWFSGMSEPNELIPSSWIRIDRNGR